LSISPSSNHQFCTPQGCQLAALNIANSLCPGGRITGTTCNLFGSGCVNWTCPGNV
jgi:hypothetical protein